MNGYLLDTDIVVFFLRNKKNIAEHLALLSPNDIFVSEVTVAELEYGNRCSGRYEDNKWMVDRFLSSVNIVPFSDAIHLYAEERYRLRMLGQSIEDFDLLIGCTAVSDNLIMVTNNAKHYSRIKDIRIENWVV
ncbi:PIN domain-containing protein [Prevotella merdae]|uniref:PIN domain-containing protein n=1 Tax=Prevotella merdae TaxID=2079531 RepID=UPI003567CEC9